MTSTSSPVDDLVAQAADLLNAAQSLVDNRLAAPPKECTAACLMNSAKALQDTAREFQTLPFKEASTFRGRLDTEIASLKTETKRITEYVDTQLRDWVQQQEQDDASRYVTSGLFPEDVIGVIASFLPPTTDEQRPLMLVNKTWLEGVASQNAMKFEPKIRWPFAAFRIRNSALCLVGGVDRDVEELAHELPCVTSVHVRKTRGDPLTDKSFLNIGKLKLLTTLRINGHQAALTNAGMKHLANLRQLTSLSLTLCNNISELGLENFERLTSLEIISCRGILSERVFDTSKGALRHLTALKISDDVLGGTGEHLRTYQR